MLLLFACFCSFTKAQVAAGDVISGNVSDDIEPLMMVNVVEIDNNRRIVAHGVTDINGNFSFRVVNPKDKIQISYIGYKTEVLPIDRKVFKIKMKSSTQLQEVVVKAVKKTETTGLSIPVTELSVASQTISMKEFEGLGLTSVDEALQGRIAGLDIVANSGNLGSGTTMRLRGVSTINGNANPLIVVNGNVWTNDADADFDYNNANEEKFAELLNVNPEDIESISVLKDAAATAIWGSQGANGVIEIKTKRGQRGKTKVQYSYRFTGAWSPEGLKVLNGDDYTMYLKEAYFNPKLDNSYSDKTSSKYIWELNYDSDKPDYQMFNNNTDWRDEVTQFAANSQHFVSLTGGGEKARFRVSGGYDSQNGTVIKQHLDRFTTRVALDYYVSDRITVSTNFDMTYTLNKKNYRTNGNNANDGDDLLAIAYKKMPNIAVYEEDANGVSTGQFYSMNKSIASSVFADDQLNIPNPVAVAYLAKNDEKTLKLSPEFILKYDLLGTETGTTKLTYEGRIIFDIFSKDENTFLPASLSSEGWSGKYANRASSESYKSHGLTTTHSLTFQPHFNNEDHSLLVLARMQYVDGSSTAQYVQKYGLATSDITSATSDGIYEGFSNSFGQWKSNYYTMQVHYSYKGRYSITATARYDGSTKFGVENRWGLFPAVSARWNISDEPWMEKVKWLSMLSIRPGWGQVGRQPDAEYLFYSKYGGGASYVGNTSIQPNNIRLSGLKWESKETWNLGFDFGFFDDKINGDLSLYTQKTTDLLMEKRKIPGSSGFSELAWSNVGAMRNVGWEFNINGNRIVQAGKFSMNFNITFANNRNEILEMDPTVLESINGDFDYTNGSYLSRVQLNNPLGSIYGFRYKGVYQYSEYSDEEVKGVSGPNAPVARNANGDVIYDENGRAKAMMFNYGGTGETEFQGGDAIYEDINHDGQINELDIVYLGSSLPKLTGGFGTKLMYDRWSLNLQFNYRLGNKIINRARMNAEGMYDNLNQTQGVNWRWHSEGDIAVVPRALYKTGFNWLGSDRFVEDGSFLRLNYAQISYAMPSKLIKQWGLSQLSFYLTLNNVFCITKYSGADPEVAQAGWNPCYDDSRTPRQRSFTFGATIAF